MTPEKHARGCKFATKLGLRIAEEREYVVRTNSLIADGTKQAGAAVTLQISIWEMLGSNLSQDTIILTEAYHVFSQPLHTHARIVHLLGHEYFLPNPFQFIDHSTI
jgi:hypothetical protein